MKQIFHREKVVKALKLQAILEASIFSQLKTHLIEVNFGKLLHKDVDFWRLNPVSSSLPSMRCLSECKH